MYILQISDLHISSTTDVDKLKEKISRLKFRLEEIIPIGSDIVCCLLGDFVDKGNIFQYSTGNEILLHLKQELLDIFSEQNVSFEIVPGNHDLCEDPVTKVVSLSAFNNFASSFLGRKIDYSDMNSSIESEHFGYNFVNVSTVIHGENKFGVVNFDGLQKLNFKRNNIMLAHHSLISSDDNDAASIRNGYQLQKILEDNHFIALLHGHTHGCKRYTVGRNCQVIGVGPMFKEITDISNQCNLVCVSGGSISKIITLTYHGDRMTWDSNDTYEKVEDNNYYSNSVYDAYSQVLQDANANLLLPNLRIQIKQEFSEFEKEITDKFGECIEDARAWQASEKTEFLDYTHGELMKTKDMNWDEFIVSTLKKNPTSKRAIVPLIDREMAFKGGDEKLVSFDIVQFGFTSADCKDLHITVYFRALEIRYFLPLNLTETLLMAQKIRYHIRTIQNLTICLFAFRGEAKKQYGCYKKSQIDLLSESSLCKIVSDRNYSRLKTLLSEKANMGDSVIELTWFNKLHNALNAFYERQNKEAVLKQIATTEQLLMELKKAREHCSDYSITQDSEDLFSSELLKLAIMLMEE